jgi:hypothetical protein
MADNFAFTPGTGATGASDDVGGVHVPRAKIGFGVDGAYADANLANPWPVQGGVAHDAADDATAPVKVGGRAIAALSGATLVASADRAQAQMDLDGALLVRADRALGDVASGNASNNDGSSTAIITAGGAGVKNYLTDITITNTSASNIYVEIKDGATVRWTFPVPANAGVTHSWATPLAGTANTAWNFHPSAATTTIICSASGFRSKV